MALPHASYGVAASKQPAVKRSGIPPFVVRVQYPQLCVPVSESTLDSLLTHIRQIPGLQTYECSLEASVSSMSSGSSSETDGVVTLQDPPTHYCKTACVGDSTPKTLKPTILIEILTTEDPPNLGSDIEGEIIGCVKNCIIPHECKQSVWIRLFHLEIKA